MNKRFLIMLVIALVLAGGAAWLAKRWVDIQTGKTPVTAEQNTVRVYVAATNIPSATHIEKTQYKLAEWPKSSLPPGAFTEADLQADPNAIEGKVTQRDFYDGEILLKPQLKEHLGGSTLSAFIKEGMRAMSVRVNDVAGVAGFILPGNTADIIFSRGGNGETYTLLKNIKILAIDQTSSTETDKPAVVNALTLEVTPKQAERLVTAMQGGSLYFTLRNPMDSDTTIEPPEIQPAPPKELKPERPKKAPLTIMILPWDKQNFRPSCPEGSVC